MAKYFGSGVLGNLIRLATTSSTHTMVELMAKAVWVQIQKLSVAVPAQAPSAVTAKIPPIRVSPSDTDISWDLSAVYAASEDVNVYGRVAKGFRAPSVQGRLMFADATLLANQLVTVADTETVLSWEAGVKAQLWDNRLRLGFALFRYTVNDQQLTAVGGASNIATLVNADRTVGQGAELDLQAWLTDNLYVTFCTS